MCNFFSLINLLALNDTKITLEAQFGNAFKNANSGQRISIDVNMALLCLLVDEKINSAFSLMLPMNIT